MFSGIIYDKILASIDTFVLCTAKFTGFIQGLEKE